MRFVQSMLVNYCVLIIENSIQYGNKGNINLET